MTKLAVAVVLILLTLEVRTQPPPPAASGPPGGTKKSSGWPSIAKAPPNVEFVSLEGRFKIALPKSIQGYGAISPKQSGTSATGEQYTWKFEEVEIWGFYLDNPDSALNGSAAQLSDLTANAQRLIAERRPDAKLLSESQSLLGRVPYTTFLHDFGSDGFVSTHMYLDNKRIYRFAASFKDRAIEGRLNQIFKTFTVIEQSEIDAELKRRYDSLKPQPLPQSPAVAKAKTDAEDEGLSGKVKKIVTESEDRSGTWGVQGRKVSSVVYYDSTGALTQRDSYDSKGNPFQITVYGFIDGKRVSNSKTTRYEYDPPPMLAAPHAGPPRKSDPRYEYSFEYKYEGGKLVEKQMGYNDGRKGMRYVYKHSPDQVEGLVYTDEGKLNQRYISTLDGRGNEVERTNFGVVNYEIYGDRKYRYTYEFDSVGNWIKKFASQETKEGNVAKWVQAYVTYRTITYY